MKWYTYLQMFKAAAKKHDLTLEWHFDSEMTVLVRYGAKYAIHHITESGIAAATNKSIYDDLAITCFNLRCERPGNCEVH